MSIVDRRETHWDRSNRKWPCKMDLRQSPIDRKSSYLSRDLYRRTTMVQMTVTGRLVNHPVRVALTSSPDHDIGRSRGSVVGEGNS